MNHVIKSPLTFTSIMSIKYQFQFNPSHSPPCLHLLQTLPITINTSSFTMRDLSFLLLKNSIASRMKKGIRTFCHGVASTSTVSQKKTNINTQVMIEEDEEKSSLTLEQMILKLNMEEEAERRARALEEGEITMRRMSCVDSSDILRSARNALEQYPRFSLDGRDAMCRSSFRNFGRKEKTVALPATLAGESVVWCKPGVVAKLMGLDAVPIPLNGRRKVKVGGCDVGGRKGGKKMEKFGRRKAMAVDMGMGMVSCSPVNCSVVPRKTIEDWQYFSHAL